MEDIFRKDSEISIIEAAGGVVGDAQGRVLMMLRRGMWDLPKGHLDEGETLRECAAREVCEECGLDPSKLETGDELIRTEYMLPIDSTRRRQEHGLKRVTWFAMLYTGDTTAVTPQTEEDITALEWLSMEDALERAKGSYPTILEVINQYYKYIS